MNREFKGYVIIYSTIHSFAKNANVSLCLSNENVIGTAASSALCQDHLANAIFYGQNQPLYFGNNFRVACSV